MELPFNFKSGFSSLLHSGLSCLFLILSSGYLKGQCGAPDQLPSLECQDAPLICLQDWCYESSSIQLFGWPGFCGNNTAVHNPQYYAFFAETEIIEFEIHVDYCTGGTSLQAAILGNCPWGVEDVFDCDPGTPPGGTMFLSATDLLVGQIYWLLIDGSAGATCGYTITSVSGVFMPELFGEITQINASEDSVFQGNQTLNLEAAPAVSSAHGYYWVADWNSDTITSTLPSTTIYVPCDVLPGTYSICVRAFSGCDTSDTEVCTQIEVLEQTDVIKPAATFCSEAFPFTWITMPVSGPGTYTQTFYTEYNCPYDSIWQIDAYPEVEIGQIDTNVCGYEFNNYDGQIFYDSGTYILEFPGQSMNGCDSTAELHLTFHYPLEFFVEAVCEDSQLLLRPIVTLHYLPNDTKRYAWYDCNFTELLSTSETFNPDTQGCYCLIVDHNFCSDTICSTYLSDPCQSDCSLVRDTTCAGESLLFNYNGGPSLNAEYHWLIDQQGTEEKYYSEQKSFTLTYTDAGWYNASLTVIDSSTTTTCIDSFYINGYTSEASICCNGPECGTCTDLTINLSGAAPWTVYLNGTFQNDTIYDVTDSAFIYTVCPPADSLSVYFLTVKDSFNQCDARILVNQPTFVLMRPEPVAEITQMDDTLCATFIENTSYGWLTCGTYEFLSNNICYQPTASGCYCLKVTTGPGCTDSICYDFVLSAVNETKESGIKVYPNPSNGAWQVTLPDFIRLPVAWALYDVYNRKIETGLFDDTNVPIQLTVEPESGLYFLRFMSATRQAFTTKVVIQ
ncbi:MAG: T9SS type A sorting domain-containing protein [Saprospiraceae bacterium]|nr:T9SS type A sorting domain-containing protein [Saprospiraceae bacterium]